MQQNKRHKRAIRQIVKNSNWRQEISRQAGAAQSNERSDGERFNKCRSLIEATD
jgi:hypothetical protein